jgi:Na+/proline symporter
VGSNPTTSAIQNKNQIYRTKRVTKSSNVRLFYFKRVFNQHSTFMNIEPKPNKKNYILIIIVIGLFLFGVGAIVWNYFGRTNRLKSEQNQPNKVISSLSKSSF